MACDQIRSIFKCVDEAESDFGPSFASIVIDGCLDITASKLSGNNYSLAVPTTRSIAKAAEVMPIDRFGPCGRCSVKQKPAQNKTVLISTDQFADILAARPVAPPRNLLIDEALQVVR